MMSDDVQTQRSALLGAHDQSLNVAPMRREIIPTAYSLLSQDVQPSVSSGHSNSKSNALQLNVNMRHLVSKHRHQKLASSVQHQNGSSNGATITSSNVHTPTNHSPTFTPQVNHSTILGKRKAGVLDGSDVDFKPTRLGRETARALQLQLDTQRDKANTSASHVKEGDLDADATSGLGVFTNMPLPDRGPHDSPTAVAGGTASPQHASPTKSARSTRKSAHLQGSLKAFWDNLGDDISPATDSGVSTRSSASIKRHIPRSVTPENPSLDSLEAFWDRLGDDSSIRETSPAESGGVSTASIKLRKQRATMHAGAEQRRKGKQPVRAHPCFSDSGPASGSHVTLERTRAPSMHDTEVDEEERAVQPEIIDVEGWSNMLRQIYLTRKNLSDIFGDDEPSDCQKLLNLLQKIDDNKNWITYDEAFSTRLAKRLKKIYLSCVADGGEAETVQVASRILDNFGQRFSNRRFP